MQNKTITITRAIREALEELTEDALQTFCFQLRDRREEPRVRRASVEGKTVLELTDLLVSTFTESGAREVALEILRLINCNQEALTLELRTRASLDQGKATLRKKSYGELEREPSEEAKNHVAEQSIAVPLREKVKRPEEVEGEAKACVTSEGMDNCNDFLVLSRFTLQFGQYKGKTFKWLLENDVRYAARIVVSHQREQWYESHLMSNKDSLTKYAMAHPDVMEEVSFEHQYEEAKKRSCQPGQEGMALVGFGIHRSETLQGLYESTDKVKISYVNYLRRMNSSCDPGSRMEVAIQYILRHDQKARCSCQ